MPQYNALIKKYKDKPVKFIAVAAGDTLAEAKQYAGQTKLAMPIFADSLSLMETRYGFTISLNNIHQYRVIGPDGTIVGGRMDEQTIDQAIAAAERKYDPEDYDKKLAKAVELLEWNQHAAAVKALKPFLKKKDTAEAAQKLYDAAKAEVKGWVDEAEGLKESDPVAAYDLYDKAADALPTDEVGKAAAAAMKALKGDKAVKDELAARKMYAKVEAAISKAKPEQKSQVAKFCKDLVKKYPDTPTAEKVKALAEELGEPITE